MLGDGVTTGIAAEILKLHTAGVIDVDISIEGSEWVLVNHCKPVACLDLAAARGLRGCKGKDACLCGCRGA
eukprot:4557478-Pleurochrysis_carterae.AAC.1